MHFIEGKLKCLKVLSHSDDVSIKGTNFEFMITKIVTHRVFICFPLNLFVNRMDINGLGDSDEFVIKSFKIAVKLVVNVFNFISYNELHFFMHHFFVRNELFNFILSDFVRCKLWNVISAHLVFEHLLDCVYSRFQLKNHILKLIHLVLKLLDCTSFSPSTSSLEHW